MASKKHKPATVGEKIVMAAHKWPSPDPVRSWPITHRTAKAIDRAIARAVRKERERCSAVIVSERDDERRSDVCRICLGRALRAIEENET